MCIFFKSVENQSLKNKALQKLFFNFFFVGKITKFCLNFLKMLSKPALIAFIFTVKVLTIISIFYEYNVSNFVI